MMGKGVLVYGIVFTFVITLTIVSFSIRAFAAVEILKFDQPKIALGHSDAITIIDSSAITTISFENFESGFNTWDNAPGDTGDDCWMRFDDPPSTPNTGPRSQPNTGADGTDWYVYYESSTNGCADDFEHEFLLYNTLIDFEAYSDIHIEFWTHLYDGGGWFNDDMGVLSLEIEDVPLGTGAFKEVWSSVPPTGSQGDQWNQIPPIDLSAHAPEGGQRQIRFVATDTKSGSQSDMAVDEIKIQGNRLILPSTVISYENFETLPSTWDNAPGDTGDDCWMRFDDPPSTPNTGPRSQPNTGADGTDWYVYYESSTNGCADDFEHEFLLYNTLIDFEAYSDIHIEFWTHLYDGGGWFNDDMGVLSLQLEDVTPCSTPGIEPCSLLGFTSGARTFTEVWSSAPPTGSQGDQWNQIPPINLSALAPEEGQRQIRFVATDTKPGSQSDMAVDEIIIRGIPNDYIVNVASYTSAQPDPANIIDEIKVPIKYRNPNHFWQLVEFGTTTDEGNRQLEVAIGGSVEVTHGLVHSAIAEIIDPDGAITNWQDHDSDSQPANCVTHNLGGDEDEDGVCDDWEPTNGDPMIINYPTPLPLYHPYEMNPTTGLVCDSFLQIDPANPVPCFGSDKRDIYVEIDYMDGHKPNLEALYEVIEAFANAPASAPGKPPGIRLHIQLDSDVRAGTGPIPHQDCVIFPGANDDHGFDQIKEVYFGTDEEHNQHPPGKWGKLQKKQIFHYALYVHTQCGDAGSAVAEIPGNDMMIHLGFETGGIGNPDEQAGTFMHELGHNLNLEHGGKITDTKNCKPNHLSVMSYSRQFPISNADRALDFSRQSLGSPASQDVSLKEVELQEPSGIDTYTFNPNEGIVYGPVPPLFPPPTHSNINWNDNTRDDEMGPYQFDVNYFPGIDKCDVPQNDEELMGYADWDEGIMILNSRETNVQEWANGRSAAAKANPAVWEDGASAGPFIPSPTCPSLKQVIDWADPTWLAKARNSTSPDHELAKEKIQGHLSNYRICEGGAAQSDTLRLKELYLQSLLIGVPKIVAFYGEHPDQVIDEILEHKVGFLEQIWEIFTTKTLDKILQEKLQSHYTIVESTLVHHDNSLDTKTKEKLQDIKELIEFKAHFFNVTLNHTSIEDVIKAQPIFAQSELDAGSIKKMRELRVDSMLQYLNNTDESHFYGSKNATISYYNQSIVQIKNYIQNDNYAEAALVMANLDHVAKISNSTTLEKLESATDIIIDQYTRAIPEFGTIASLILVASITCILILTTKTRNIFMPKNYQ